MGQAAPQAVATEAVRSIDLRRHTGVHPRLGAVDVVPFVALAGSTDADAVTARDRFATWLAAEHDVPCFLYGRERSLPEVRRQAFAPLVPDVGPDRPHPQAGATAVGARRALVAFNVWVDGLPLALVREVAEAVRRPGIRSLGLPVGPAFQVSMNLTEPASIGPDDAYRLVAEAVQTRQGHVAGAELVGLLPADVLHRIDPARWAELDLGEDRTIEGRLAGLG
jgi:glutamate formiminotransferase